MQGVTSLALVVIASVHLMAQAPQKPATPQPQKPAAQGPAKFENFTATTTNMAVGNAETVKINVLSWTAAPEREKLLAVLKEKGEEQLLEALKAAPSAGYIWTSESLGYSLRYTFKTTLPNGGERIIVATDRPLGAWSRTAWKASASKGAKDAKEPQLTLIEIRLNRQGRGEGKMSLAGRIVADADGNTLALDNYAGAPVLLKGATRVKEGETQ
jgi:hypothetical protein